MLIQVCSIFVLIICSQARIIPVREDPESDLQNISKNVTNVYTTQISPAEITNNDLQTKPYAAFQQKQFILLLPPVQQLKPLPIISAPLENNIGNSATGIGLSYFHNLGQIVTPNGVELKEEYYAHPRYYFAYGVEDRHSGDIHSQKESREGDKVYGEYSLHDADGLIRTVKYTADDKNGFNAIVERTDGKTHINL